MTTTVTTSSGVKVSTHEIALKGYAGIILWVILIATIFFVVGFSTTGWEINQNSHQGLWERCICTASQGNAGWFKAAQAMFIMSFISMAGCLVLAGIYMFFHRIHKNWVLIGLGACLAVTVLLFVIGLSVFGSNSSNQSYSFAFVVIACILCAIAGVIVGVQMKRSHAV